MASRIALKNDDGTAFVLDVSYRETVKINGQSYNFLSRQDAENLIGLLQRWLRKGMG